MSTQTQNVCVITHVIENSYTNVDAYVNGERIEQEGSFTISTFSEDDIVIGESDMDDEGYDYHGDFDGSIDDVNLKYAFLDPGRSLIA